MVTTTIQTNVREIIDSVFNLTRTEDQEILSEPIIIKMSPNMAGYIVLDLSHSVSTIFEVSFNADESEELDKIWAPINENVAVTGLQNRFIGVKSGDAVNFRAKAAGTVQRLVVSKL